MQTVSSKAVGQTKVACESRITSSSHYRWWHCRNINLINAEMLTKQSRNPHLLLCHLALEKKEILELSPARKNSGKERGREWIQQWMD
jgi:hypothetical protein